MQDVHSRSLATSTALSAYYVQNFITPLEVIRVLNETGIRFMLVGTHGLGGWMRKPRASPNVDLLVAAGASRKTLKGLLEAFPHLEEKDNESMNWLRNRATKVVAIHVLKPNLALYREALKYSQPVESGGQLYQIPSLELALTMKFTAMISLTRAYVDKLQDTHDFMCIVKSNPDIDLAKLHALGQLVYNGGGDEVVEKVRQVRAGEKLKL
jgi:hypothetical protein